VSSAPPSLPAWPPVCCWASGPSLVCTAPSCSATTPSSNPATPPAYAWASPSSGAPASGRCRTARLKWISRATRSWSPSALAILRYAPAAPWGGTFGVGFSRLDLEDYQGGPLGLPVFLLEGGARRRLGPDGLAFVDLMFRGGWGSSAGIEEPTEWTDWWLLQPVIAVGFNLK